MICPKCGRESNSRFCVFCGTPLQAPSAPAVEAPQQPQGPQQQWTPPQGGQQQGPQYQGQQQGPQYQGQSQGTQPQEVQSGPVQWQQAVRYDANSTYQYHQTYDAQNQPGGDQKDLQKIAKRMARRMARKAAKRLCSSSFSESAPRSSSPQVCSFSSGSGTAGSSVKKPNS